jgi:glycosyltransferase involved in cell wall biosynthesis
MTPFFSVILPTYNRAHRIQRAIESILGQTYSNWELIIVDDASTDYTEQHVVPYLSDTRIRYLKNSVNLERCKSRNLGVKTAIGTYICFLDSDDYHLPNHLETFYEEMNKRNFPEAFLFTNSYNETEAGERSERFCPPYKSSDPCTYFMRYTVNPQRWCVHREVMLKHLFDPEVIICEDMETSLRMVTAGVPVYQINERTTVYVAASDSFTHGDPKKWEKELFYLKRIFSKPQFKKRLPIKEKRRLLSMCYFHLAQTAALRGERKNAFWKTIRSLILFPKGYKPGLNKILFVLILYNFPLVGRLFQKLFRKKTHIQVPLPSNISKEHQALMQPYASYTIQGERIVHLKGALITPEGLIGKYGRLHRYCAFNLRGYADKNFYYPFARLFLEQTLVSLKGKSLIRLYIPGKSLVIHTKWFNYAFWLNSALVRLLLVEKAGLLKDVKLIYPENWERIPYVNESLALFPELKKEILPHDQLYASEELYFPEVRQYTGAINPDHVRMIRDEIPKRLGIQLMTPYRKVYISRKKRGVRMPENEENIIILLKADDFEIIDFDDLNFKEQVQLMTQTKVLISIHGAGMANINFMQKGSTVIELINEPYAKTEYTFPFWKLGTLNELNYHVLFCTVNDKSKTELIGSGNQVNEKDYLVNQNVNVEIEKLSEIVTTISENSV